ncbi:Protein bcp1 [Penicillium maclennaniae]|uniref:Protein bcp1 n=1 Tax=Penicillium maclennaniae TaxID=1343394 RepID=UPI002540B594|nr:Protein bcp1 [Penicillium maclennaniae]KAJ5678109.1 Protein bcp1 [Penicillium maclennaniae]
MGKRKQDLGDVPMGGTKGDDESDDDVEMVNVDFEWFDPQPAIDFHGLKNLLRQLFDNDAQMFDLSALADLILSQPTLGSTVKTDGNESDPYAFLTVLNLQEHKDKPVIQELTKYIKTKAAANPALSALHELISQTPVPPIGLILTERVINMPSEVIPPMYNMLLEEMAWAIQDNEPYNFSHYVIISKNYQEASKEKKKAGETAQQFFFHPEDEVLQRNAVCSGTLEYTHQQDDGHSDSKRAFQEVGIRTNGSLTLIDGSKFEAAVKAVTEYLNPQ